MTTGGQMGKFPKRGGGDYRGSRGGYGGMGGGRGRGGRGGGYNK